MTFFFFPPFPSQTHNHSVCIRPPLLPFNVTSQSATFQLKGSFVRSIWALHYAAESYRVMLFSLKVILFSQASISELQVWRSQFNFKTQKPSFFEKLTPLKVKQAAQQRSTARQHNSFCTTRQQHATIVTRLYFSTCFCRLQLVDGSFILHLAEDEVYTLTTVTTGQKGSYPDPPRSARFPKVYKDDFNVRKYNTHRTQFGSVWSLDS